MLISLVIFPNVEIGPCNACHLGKGECPHIIWNTAHITSWSSFHYLLTVSRMPFWLHFLTLLLVITGCFGRRDFSWSSCEPDLLPVARASSRWKFRDDIFNLAVLL